MSCESGRDVVGVGPKKHDERGIEKKWVEFGRNDVFQAGLSLNVR